MMKIAMIFAKSLRGQIFSDYIMEQMHAIGDIAVNETDDTSPDTIKRILSGADIAVTSWKTPKLDADILDAAPDLKLIAHAAGSVKPVVSDAVWERRIRVTGSPKPLGYGVAETALGLSIVASKNIFYHEKNTAAGGWSEGKEHVRELFDITVGVIGAGCVGKHYIHLMHNFDVSILVYDPFLTEEAAERIGVKKTDLETLLESSDIVSVHAPSISETYHMLNAHTLPLMKRDAVLINTARGSIIDEDALYQHMKAGNLKYACLDVTDPEPPAKDHPLRSLPNVILTPHLAGLVNNGKRRIGMHVLQEIQRFLAGEPMECEVTSDILDRLA